MLCVLSAPVLPAERSAEIAALKRTVAAQSLQIQELVQRLSVLEKRTTASEPAGQPGLALDTPGVIRPSQSPYDGGFGTRTEDDAFSLKANGFLQARFTASRPAAGTDVDNFDVALARFALSGNAFGPDVHYFMQYEATTFSNSNRVGMLDWWMAWSSSPNLQLQAGRFILPYSRQFYTHPGDLLFPDLSEADYAFDLPRAVGAHASGDAGWLHYDAAIVNSVRALDGGGQQNASGSLGALVRLEADILEPYGYNESSPKPVEEAQLSVGVAAAYNPVDEASGFQNLMPGDRARNLTVDLGFREDRLSIQAARYFRTADLALAGAPDNDDRGYYAQVGYYLVPERWELALRTSGVDFDAANNPAVAGDVTAYTVGLNRYFRGHDLKLQADFSILERETFAGLDSTDRRLRIQSQLRF